MQAASVAQPCTLLLLSPPSHHHSQARLQPAQSQGKTWLAVEKISSLKRLSIVQR